MRESLAESAILPRESIFDPPPPVPPKDTRPNTQIYELSAEPLEASIEVVLDIPATKTDEEPQRPQNARLSALARQNSSKSGEIQIRLPLPTSPSQHKSKKSAIKSNLHPLMISPPSPVPAQVLQMLNVPQRPARSPSTRLSSTLTRKKDLTTSKILVLDFDRPETADSYQTNPHTRYNSASRIKYGRGKHAATELVPQPSDDPRDPLVSGNFTHAQNCC